MATPCTHNTNIVKPDSTDNYDIGVFNSNFQEIDNEMYANQQSAAQIMTGATAQADGVSGRVPAPLTTEKDKVLHGDGSWDTALSRIDFTQLSAQQIADLKTALGI